MRWIAFSICARFVGCGSICLMALSFSPDWRSNGLWFSPPCSCACDTSSSTTILRHVVLFRTQTVSVGLSGYPRRSRGVFFWYFFRQIAICMLKHDSLPMLDCTVLVTMFSLVKCRQQMFWNNPVRCSEQQTEGSDIIWEDPWFRSSVIWCTATLPLVRSSLPTICCVPASHCRTLLTLSDPLFSFASSVF